MSTLLFSDVHETLENEAETLGHLQTEKFEIETITFHQTECRSAWRLMKWLIVLDDGNEEDVL